MPRAPIWRSIAADLSAEIASGHYGPGDKLPTEARLSARFGVNRHTVRHALAAMAEEGLVLARRGAGVFVAQTPTVYPIGKRVRFHQNLGAAGQVPGKEILSLEARGGDRSECRALGLAEGAQVLAYEGLSLADGAPVAVFRSVFPAVRFAGLLDDLAETSSVTAALARHGVEDYTRLETRLTAVSATATQALHLRLPDGAPLLRTVAINVDGAGRPIEYGHTWFAGDRVTLTVGAP